MFVLRGVGSRVTPEDRVATWTTPDEAARFGTSAGQRDEHDTRPRLRGPPRGPARVRPPGRPGRQGARRHRGAAVRRTQPRVVGLVVEVFGRRQIFAPMTRVTNIDPGQVITTGLLNMRRFEKRSTETLVVGQMLDRRVKVREHRRRGGRLRRRHGADPDQGLGALPGRAHRGRQGFPQAPADPRRGVGRRRGSLPAAGQPGRRAPDRLARRPAPGGRCQRDPRAAARAPQPGGRRRWTTSGLRTSSRSCPRRTRSRSSSTSTPNAPPTSSRRCPPTTPPT